MVQQHDLDIQNHVKRNGIHTLMCCIFIFLVLLLISSATSNNISQLVNSHVRFLVQTEAIQVMVGVVFILLILTRTVQIHITQLRFVLWMSIPIWMMLLTTIAFNQSTTESSPMAMIQASVHIFLLYMLLCTFYLASVKFNVNAVVKIILGFGMIEALLGMFQHFGRITIFNTENLNAIFFLNGLSSSDSTYLQMGASVRAFGTFDSGLTLGTFLIFILALLIDYAHTHSRLKYVFIFVVIVAIYSTQTRNVYIGLILFILTLLLQKSTYFRYISRGAYLIILCVSALLPWLSGLLGWLMQFATNLNISTFGVRFNFIDQALAQVPDVWHFLFGSNITSRSGIPIDNSFLSLMLQYGLISAAISLLVQISVFGKSIIPRNFRRGGIVSFLFIAPIISASNNIVNEILVLMVIIVFLHSDSAQD